MHLINHQSEAFKRNEFFTREFPAKLGENIKIKIHETRKTCLEVNLSKLYIHNCIIIDNKVWHELTYRLFQT